MTLGILGPFPPFRGGIATFNVHLWTELHKRTRCIAWNYRRLYPRLIFPGQTQLDESRSPFQVPADAVFDPFRPWHWPAGLEAIDRSRPRALIVAVWTPLFAPSLAVFLNRLRRRTRVPLVAVCHNVQPHESIPLGGIFQRRLLRAMDTVIVHCRRDREVLTDAHPGQTVIALYHPLYEQFPGPVDLDRNDARARLGLADTTRRLILFFGLVRPYKGLDVLLEAFRMLSATDPDARLLVAGEFYEKPERFEPLLGELVRSGRLILRDRFIPNEDVHLHFRAADLVVLPYRHATQSGIIPLAYQFGRGVVSTQVGGLDEMVADGESGYLVPPDDAAALAEAIRRFLARQADIESHVPGFANRFRWPGYVDALLAALPPPPAVP
ncbi:MAG TPA: glycosyltransferase [Acidobacteriota bacterium]|nr:glycosyltransferase [Acidobacteriota bacterium]HQM62385.1 glycosyltransferase [Acidobacteriota bacterium]